MKKKMGTTKTQGGLWETLLLELFQMAAAVAAARKGKKR